MFIHKIVGTLPPINHPHPMLTQYSIVTATNNAFPKNFCLDTRQGTYIISVSLFGFLFLILILIRLISVIKKNPSRCRKKITAVDTMYLHSTPLLYSQLLKV